MVVEKDEKLLQLFWDLADEDEGKRAVAVDQLMNLVLQKQKKVSLHQSVLMLYFCQNRCLLPQNHL